MTDCLKCGRAVNDAYCCVTCAGEARKHLATIAYLTAHADEKRARVGSNLLSGDGSRAAETPVPFDPRVSKVLNPIRIALQGTGRMVIEEHRPNLMDPFDYGEALGYTDPRMDRLKPASLPSVANWLIGFTDWLRHQQSAAEEFDTFERAASNVEQLFDRAPDRLYVGECGAEEEGSVATCHEALYIEVNAKGDPESTAINCPRCTTVHDVTKRRADLKESLAGYQATTKEISHLCRMTIDGDVSVRMLQIYAKHGFLLQHGVRLEQDSMGRMRRVATYRIGDVEPAVDLWKDYLTDQRDKKRRGRRAA